jgi:hypothetical protein
MTGVPERADILARSVELRAESDRLTSLARALAERSRFQLAKSRHQRPEGATS